MRKSTVFQRVVSLLAGLLIVGACHADPAATPPAHDWKLGADYFLIDPRVPTSTGDKIEVAEVFSYACPHCAHFLPDMDELKSKLPANAQIVLIPAVFRQEWEPFARAFYTAKALGILDKTHAVLFQAIHTQHLPLTSIDTLANGFYANYGVSAASFLSTAGSFVVDSQIARGNQLVQDYGVDSTPTLIVNGKFRIALGANIGAKDAIEIALYLVKQESAAKK